MKKLIFILLILASCEKELPQEEIQRTCWECKYRYSGGIPQQIRRYCDGTDIGLSTGIITEAQIRQYEREHYLHGVLTVECTSYEEK
jgi:hypothetical protein